MEPIRLLHCADLHIGMENYGQIDPQTGINMRVVDFLRRFDEVIDQALAREADLVLFAGDAFKTRDPNPTYQREFARRVKRLADAHVPAVLLVGNHDLPTMEKKASSVDIFRVLDVPGITVGWREEVHRVQTRRGPVQVATAPYPLRSRLLARDEFRGKTIEELDGYLQGLVCDMIRGMAAGLDPDLPAVLAGHFSVSGAVYGSERSVMIGRDVVIPKSVLADPAWDYVALGHVHKHQELNAGGYPAVVYSGSLERIDFGEEREPKGFCWVELARGATRWEFVPVQARRFLTVRADARGAEDPTAAVLQALQGHALEDTVVRVLIQLDAGQEPAFREREVRAALAGAYYLAALHKEVERPARVRLGDRPAEGLSPQQLLRLYLENKQLAPGAITALLARADEVMDEKGSEPAGEKASEKASAQTSEKASEKASESTSEKGSGV
jgi:exonuclease SbcD